MGLNHQKPAKNELPKIDPIIQKEEKISKSSFKFLNIIGRGGFGKVWKVYSKKYKSIYAMKEMSKTKIIDKRSEVSVKAERNLLERMNHPFIINMHFSFQDNEHLYIAMDYLTGGDLRYQLCLKKKFSEQETKFFIACIILALEYIHSNNIIHRDLKPENLVLDSRGYVKLTDFGIAKFYVKENKKETSGTPGYMAPEVMKAQNHTIAVDYFALGVIGYEFMNGKRPYLGKNRKEIKDKILSTQVQIKKNMIPPGWGLESADFINRLIQRKPANRLGLRGPTEVKEHLWFKDYDWKDLYLGKLVSPYKPKNGDNFDFNYCNEPEKIGPATQERYYNIATNKKYKGVFVDFSYFNRFSKAKYINNSQEFTNPHIKYIEEEEQEEKKEKTIEIRTPIIINNNIININNYNFINFDDKNTIKKIISKEKDINSIKKINLNENFNNESFIKKNDLLIPLNGLMPDQFLKNEEQFSYIRKLSNFKSTQTLLKGYKRSSSALNIRSANRYLNYQKLKK